MCGITLISKAFQAMPTSASATKQWMLPPISSQQFSRSCRPAQNCSGI